MPDPPRGYSVSQIWFDEIQVLDQPWWVEPWMQRLGDFDDDGTFVWGANYDDEV